MFHIYQFFIHFIRQMQIQIPVVENSLCKESYRRINQVDKESQFDDRVVCAGLMEGGKDRQRDNSITTFLDIRSAHLFICFLFYYIYSCQGDSGGPLMLPIANNKSFPFYQIGIVSWAG